MASQAIGSRSHKPTHYSYVAPSFMQPWKLVLKHQLKQGLDLNEQPREEDAEHNANHEKHRHDHKCFFPKGCLRITRFGAFSLAVFEFPCDNAAVVAWTI